MEDNENNDKDDQEDDKSRVEMGLVPLAVTSERRQVHDMNMGLTFTTSTGIMA